MVTKNIRECITSGDEDKAHRGKIITLHKESAHRVFAASSATAEEEKIAKLGRLPDGTKPVAPKKKFKWRPQVKNIYEEPEVEVAEMENLDWLFRDQGKVTLKTTGMLPPREDITNFDHKAHGDELDKNLQWRDCPDEFRPLFMAVILKYWDAFHKGNMSKHIRGYEFSIDIGTNQPVCCKQPRYGPHEAAVINELIEKLANQGLIEQDTGPYGAMVVLAAKPNQGHKHWSEYIFRLCVSYRKLNAVTRPFQFHIARCDDAVELIGKSKVFITLDLDAGYWQVKLHEGSKDKTAFFVPDGKMHWRVMPMGILNAHAFFVSMTMDMKREWDAKFLTDPTAAITFLREVMKDVAPLLKELQPQGTNWTQDLTKLLSEANIRQAIKDSAPGSSVIVDDLMLHDSNELSLLAYFVCILKVLVHYRVTINLRKGRFLPKRAEFVGTDVLPEGNSPAESKYSGIDKIKSPKRFSDIRGIIGIFGYYQQWMPHYEDDIAIFRDILLTKGETLSDEEEEAKVAREWTDKCEETLEKLKGYIKDGPVLKRPDPNRRFYLKTDWSKDGMGACLLQPEISVEAEEAMQQEMAGEDCKFEKLSKGLRLRPIAFLSRRCKGKERDYHSYRGEAATGLWAMRKFRHYLSGREFTWITDCNGLIRFFEGDDDFTHTTQRWRLELLSLNFTIVHRPGRMLFECDLMSRYQSRVEDWQQKAKEQEEITSATDDREKKPVTPEQTGQPSPIPNENLTAYFQRKAPTLPYTFHSPKVIGPATAQRSDLARLCDKARTTWILGGGLQQATRAMEELGSEALITLQTDEDAYWQQQHDCPDIITAHQRLKKGREKEVEWIIAPRMQDFTSSEQQQAFVDTIAIGLAKGASTIILSWPEDQGDTTENKQAASYWEKHLTRMAKNRTTDPLQTITTLVRGRDTGADTDSRHHIVMMTPATASQHWKDTQRNTWAEPGELANVLDEPNDNYSDYIHLAKSEHRRKEVSVAIQGTNRYELRTVFTATQLAPNLTGGSQQLERGEFVVETPDGWVPGNARTIRPWETLQLLGIPKEEANRITQTPKTEWDEYRERIRETMPCQAWKETLAPLITHELNRSKFEPQTNQLISPEGRKEHDKGIDIVALTQQIQKDHPHAEQAEIDPSILTYGENVEEHAKAMVSRSINRSTTLPLPTREQWIRENTRDPDIDLIMKTINERAALKASDLKDEKYFLPWKKGRLEVDNGLLVEYEEPKAKHIRQLQRVVVPPALRPTVIASYHATPMAGHVGFYKTHYRVATRYWWPNMSSDIRKAVQSCGHCRTANMTSHVGQKIMQAISYDAPFDVVAMDVWVPGKTDPTRKGGTPAQMRLAKQIQSTASLTYIDIMTGFVTTAFLQEVSSGAVSLTAFTSMFIVRGFPKLILIDAGSEFKDILIKMLQYLQIPYYVVSPENHDGILCERVHRYFNKVQKIGAADLATFNQWSLNMGFSTYAWNASPVDGTDIQRAFAATARTFKFPIDHATDDIEVPRIPNTNQLISHIETEFPLWNRQTEILKVLNDDRRKRHRDLKNNGRKQRRFQPGDLVIVRKQVRSSASKGAPAKLQMRARGPYRVLGVAPESIDSYILQKLSGERHLIGNYQPKTIKEASIRIEKLPSHLVVHKRVDTPDTRFAQAQQILARNPLEKVLGIPGFGTYAQAEPTEDYAFVRLRDLWDEPLDETDEAEEVPQTKEVQQAIEADSQQEPDPKEANEPNNRKRRRVTIDTSQQLTRPLRLNLLYEKIRQSKDKLFIIAQEEEGNMQKTWYVVQVDPDDEDTNTIVAKENGIYHCKWYFKNPTHANKLRTRDCAFWPLIKQLDRSDNYKATIPIAPRRVETQMNRKANLRWYQKPVNLGDEAVSGPFNFTEDHKIPNKNFEELKRKAHENDIDASDVDEVVPTFTKRKR